MKYAVLVILLAVATFAQASYIYSFSTFDTSTGQSLNIAGFNISVEVSSNPGGVGFKFTNNSSISSAVTSIYFEASDLSGITAFDWGAQPEIKFSEGAHNFAEGNNLNPKFKVASPSDDFSSSAASPSPKYGINPGEYLTINFGLKTGGSYQNVINQLSSGTTRIGMQVQGLPDGSGKSAINNATSVFVPEPASLILLGLGSLVFCRRK